MEAPGESKGWRERPLIGAIHHGRHAVMVMPTTCVIWLEANSIRPYPCGSATSGLGKGTLSSTMGVPNLSPCRLDGGGELSMAAMHLREAWEAQAASKKPSTRNMSSLGSGITTGEPMNVMENTLNTSGGESLERLQKGSQQQLFGWLLRPSFPGVEQLKGAMELHESLVSQSADTPQRMSQRDLLLTKEAGEQGAAALLLTTHQI
jgi:hypothetical protein